VLAGIAIVGSGCGGLGASGSISPASFLLPGIGQNDPAAPSSHPNELYFSPEGTIKTSPRIAAYSADPVQ
jgi:hypothetical protein